jgi:hypothetical protein
MVFRVVPISSLSIAKCSSISKHWNRSDAALVQRYVLDGLDDLQGDDGAGAAIMKARDTRTTGRAV